jgi:uracil-DNA glycosylase
VSHNADQLRDEVFGCEHCAGLGTFKRSPDNGRFYKFPAIIGAPGEAVLLFIGINPRQDERNLDLHNWLMASQENFKQLAQNRDRYRRPYIAPRAMERHYHCHMIVIEGVFGIGTPFEAKAAVTEIYLCANESGSALLDARRSPCAERYLGRVVEIVKPQVVVAVGKGVHQHLSDYFSDAIKAPAVRMIHPKELREMCLTQKVEKLQPTIEEIRTILQATGSGQ